MKFLSSVLIVILSSGSAFAQYSHQDSLRGTYGSGRDWWDASHYDLSVTFDIDKKEISGCNKIRFSSYDNIESKAVTAKRKMQIDLQEPMKLDSVYFGPKKLNANEIIKDGNAYFLMLPDLGNDHTVDIYFHGSPRVAKKAPWDGGIIWTQDQNKNPWVTIACQGLGASCWYPCKDSQYDEPDSASMHFTCPENLRCVSNGVFTGKTVQNKQATYGWKVQNPINSYCIIPYIGDYVNMHEHFQGENGNLEVDYWVIRGNEEKAKTQFMDAPRTLEALEYWFGPYPFYEDGYKLVHAPHLGMEHQSAVAYGNGFQNGYLGTDLSGTGIGLKWDFIIVHESGHEWFGNNVTSQDIADMWIHEGFTNYSEVLFTDYWFGTEAGNAYAIGLRNNIQNDIPIIGPYGVNKEGSGDMYYKGSNMLHTIRNIVNNDSLFRDVLRDINETYWHQTVTTEQIEKFMSSMLNVDLQPTFDQYLRTTQIPTLELVYKKGKVKYRWTNCIRSFNMPVVLGGTRLMPTRKWKSIPLAGSVMPVPNEQLYINYKVRKAKSLSKDSKNFTGSFMENIKSSTQPNSK